MKTVLSIEGMSCMHCVRHVKEALEEIQGVMSVEVSLEEKNAVVEYDEKVSLESMKAAVVEAGYEVS